ncbi:MAG: glycosyltransferase family 4 protein [Myxococcales bacterium]|nr:glycosyltransferase family 4 protein [Myxococcales bacterium]
MSRVLVATTSFPACPGDPAGAFVAESVQWIRRAGLAAHVIAPPRPAAGLPELLEGPAGLAVGAATLARLAAALHRAHRPGDVLVAHWLPTALPLIHRVPTLAWAHGGDVALLERAPRAVARHLDAHAHALAFVSDDLRARFTARLGRPPRAPQWLLPMGVQAPAPDPAFAAALRARAAGRRVVATVGRLVPIKGLDVLARALGDRDDVVWLAAGEGPERDALARLSCSFEPLGLLDPPRRDALLAVADAFVLPSRPRGRRTEGTPVALLEALASGVPSVASATGGVTALGREAGVELVPPDDPGALAAALARVLAEPPGPRRARHLQAAARFAWPVIGPDHARAVARLARAGALR